MKRQSKRESLIREVRDECEAFVKHFDSFDPDPDPQPCGIDCPELLALYKIVKKAVKQ